MRKIAYVLSRIIKKLRGKAIVNSEVPATSKIESGCTLIGTSFGEYSFCGYDCTFINCEVGSFSSIASGVIVGGARHPIEYVSTSPVFLAHKESIKKKFSRHEYTWNVNTKIGHDVWIGEGVFIKGGVTIGDGSVIGMGSVVTKDVPAYTIYAGNPASLIRHRFSNEVTQALLKLQWWNMPEHELLAIAPMFNEPEKLLKKLNLL